MVKKVISFVLTLMLATFVVAGCGIAQKLGLHSSDELQPVSSTSIGEEEAMALADKVPIKLYFAEKDGSKLVAEIRHVPKDDINDDIATAVVRELLKGSSTTATMKAVIPEGTRVNSVKVDKGVATVDLSKEFTEKFPKEKNVQNQIIYSIVNSITELKDIDKVKITIDGKTIREVNSLRLDSTFSRNADIIGKAIPITSIVGSPSPSPAASPGSSPRS